MAEFTAEAASAAMAELGWERVGLQPDILGPLAGVYESSFGVAALVLAETTFDNPGEWTRCQEAFADLVSKGEVPREKDRYLVFLISRIAEDVVAEMESALADTHLARKICLDARSRPIEEVLAESVVIAGPRIVSEESEVAEPVIADKILGDLGTRAAHVVLDRLLAGDYEEDDS